MAMFADYQPRNNQMPPRAPAADLVLCPATAQDRDEIIAIHMERQSIPHDQAAQTITRWFARTPDEQLFLVAKQANRVVAYARALYQNTPPPGWYLMGVTVAPASRRQGIATQLTQMRLDWIRERAPEAWYFVNSKNLPSLDLHHPFGFDLIDNNFQFPGANFSAGGHGLLFRKTF